MKSRLRSARHQSHGCLSSVPWMAVLSVFALCYFTFWMRLLASTTCQNSRVINNEEDNSIHVVSCDTL